MDRTLAARKPRGSKAKGDRDTGGALSLLTCFALADAHDSKHVFIHSYMY